MNCLIQNSLLIGFLYLVSHGMGMDFRQDSDFVQLKGEPEVWVEVGKNNFISLPFQIKEGYYIQANKVRDENLIPTTLSFRASEDLAFGDPDFPKPQEHKIDNNNLYVFGGETEVKIPIQINQASPEKIYVIKGNLHYQACDKAKCYFPRDYNFSLKIKVK